MSRYTVSQFMTAAPVTINVSQPLQKAHEIMREKEIRHLPVLKEGRLVGIVSLGDLRLLETLDDVDPREVKVEEAMTPDPFRVSPDAPLDEVAGLMSEKRFGSAVVVDGDRVVGVFTAIDGLRALTRLISEQGMPA